MIHAILATLKNASPLLTLFSALFWYLQLLQETSGFLAAKCSTVFTTKLCLLFDAEQVVQIRFLELLLKNCCLLFPKRTQRVVRVRQEDKLWTIKPKKLN